MSDDGRPEDTLGALRALAARKNAEYEALRGGLLPVGREGALWRGSRPPASREPRQGWKIHVAATIFSAAEILKAVAPVLESVDARFKAPVNLFELMKLNAGVFYGYSQIGKFITVYPSSEERFVHLAGELDRLTNGLDAPAVPFDRRFASQSNVYYRYGVFSDTDAGRAAFLRAPDGSLAPDSPDARTTPEWAADPLAARRSGEPPGPNPLRTRYRVFRALSQRGKGGVYLAFDEELGRPCVVKEGRRHGETAWNGTDGRRRVAREKESLARLAKSKVDVPEIYDYFEHAGNFYLVTEFIEGVALREIIDGGRMNAAQKRNAARQLAELVAAIRRAGFVWRDCKPENVIVDRQGTLRPVDFESAAEIGRRAPLVWKTPAYAPASAAETADPAEDEHALNACRNEILA